MEGNKTVILNFMKSIANCILKTIKQFLNTTIKSLILIAIELSVL